MGNKQRMQWLAMAAGLCALAVWAYWLNQSDSGASDTPILWGHFEPGELQSITFQLDEQQVHLYEHQGRWLLEPGGQPADSGKVNELVRLLQVAEIQSVVTGPRATSLNDSIRRHGLHVHLKLTGKPAFELQLGPPAGQLLANYVRGASNDKLYIVGFRGYQVKPGQVWRADRAFWAARPIIPYSVSQLSALQLQYPGKPEAHVHWQRDSTGWQLQEGLQAMNKEAVETFWLYAAQVGSYPANAAGITAKERTAILARSPFAVLIAKPKKGPALRQEFYRWPAANEPGYHLHKALLKPHHDSLLYPVKYLTLDPLLKQRNDFLLSPNR